MSDLQDLDARYAATLPENQRKPDGKYFAALFDLMRQRQTMTAHKRSGPPRNVERNEPREDPVIYSQGIARPGPGIIPYGLVKEFVPADSSKGNPVGVDPRKLPIDLAETLAQLLEERQAKATRE